MPRHFNSIAVASVIAVAVSACGQQGPLALPDEAPVEVRQKAPSTPSAGTTPATQTAPPPTSGEISTGDTTAPSTGAPPDAAPEDREPDPKPRPKSE